MVVIAVIADIVGSRRLIDRAGAQRSIEQAVARVHEDLPLAQTILHSTVGDELQGVYRALDDALASLLLLQLALPAGVECRFGLGIGPARSFPSAGGELQDGPAWWVARDAIETVHRKQERAAPSSRTWIVADDGEDDTVHTAARLANAYLLARDQLVGSMSDRTRRLAYGRCRGVTQSELARVEGVTQSAVSQALAAAGATSVVEGFFALRAAG